MMASDICHACRYVRMRSGLDSTNIVFVLWLTRFVMNAGTMPIFVRCTLNMYTMLVLVLVVDVHISSTDNVAVNLVCPS
jgi:hypothetical protein